MATATKARKPQVKQESSLDYVQQAIRDLEQARDRAGDELKARIDEATGRLREAVVDLRKRAEKQADAWEEALDHATEEARRELARRAIMAQRSPEALSEMTAAVRRRKAELTE